MAFFYYIVDAADGLHVANAEFIDHAYAAIADFIDQAYVAIADFIDETYAANYDFIDEAYVRRRRVHAENLSPSTVANQKENKHISTVLLLNL